MNTESRRKASAAYHAKREAEGLKKVTLWLSPAARFKLDALKKAAGSKDKAADAAILAWDGPPAPKASRPTQTIRLELQRPGEPVATIGGLVSAPREVHEPRPSLQSLMRPLDALTGKPLPARKAWNPQPKSGTKK